MPKPLGTLINDLAKKAGIAVDDAALVELLSSTELHKINVPDALVSSLEGGLYTLESAKPKLKAQLKTEHFGEALNGVDAEIASYLDSENVDEEIKQRILAEKSTPKRVILMNKELRALEKKLASAKPGDKDELTQQINALKTAHASTVQQKDQEIANVKSQYSQKFIDLAVSSMMKGYTIAERKDLSKDDIMLLAVTKWNAQLANDGVKVIEDDKGQPALVANDGSVYFDKSNNKHDLKSYMDTFMSVNNFLQASGGGSGDDPGDGGNTGKIIPGSASTLNTSSFDSVMDAAMADAKK